MKKITKNIIGFLVLGLIAVPIFASAAQFKSGEQVNIGVGETVSDNLYTAGGTLNIAGNIEGDLSAAGGTVNILGAVSKDAAVAGGTIVINGNIGEDARVAGGTVTINGNVGGDLLVVGGNVVISAGSVIGGDLVVRGGTVTNQAQVMGKTDVVTGPEAKDWKKDEKRAGAVFAGMGIAWWFIKTLSMLLAGLVIYVLLKPGAQEVLNMALANFTKEIGRGFLVLVAAPVALVLLMVTVVGIPFSVFGFLIYAALNMIACVFGAIILGGAVAKYGFKKPETLTAGIVFGGIVLYQVIRVVPVIGWLATFVFFLVGLGTLSRFLYSQTIAKWKQ